MAKYWLIFQLMGMLHDNKFEAAKGIRIIMDDDKVICRENGCQIMYVFLCLFRS